MPTNKKVSDRSRADYYLYLVKDKNDKTMAVLIVTKLSSNTTSELAVAHVSPLFQVWASLAPFSHLQVIGIFETQRFNPPLCFVLSEESAQLLCFPFTDSSGNEVIYCLVLPPIPLFLKVKVTETPDLTSYVINRYLLALLMLWTKPKDRVYHSNEVSKHKLKKANAVRRAVIKSRVQIYAKKCRHDVNQFLLTSCFSCTLYPDINNNTMCNSSLHLLLIWGYAWYYCCMP